MDKDWKERRVDAERLRKTQILLIYVFSSIDRVSEEDFGRKQERDLKESGGGSR